MYTTETVKKLTPIGKRQEVAGTTDRPAVMLGRWLEIFRVSASRTYGVVKQKRSESIVHVDLHRSTCTLVWQVS